MSIYENISLVDTFLRRPIRVLSNIWWAFISGPITGKPFKVKFESSTICNLKCKMCPLTSGISRKKGVLKFDNFKKVFDEIRVPYLNLTGLGEPLFNPDIFKIIKYARSRGSLVKLDSNATLLTKENIEKLIFSDPSIISISIDGTTKESYENIRVGAKFDQVIKNFGNLVKFRNQVRSKVKIHLFFVLQKENIAELTEFIRLGESLGVDVINGNMAISFGKADNKKNRDIGLEVINRVRKELEFLMKKTDTKVNIENIEDFLKNPKDQQERMREKPCFYPWYNPCITWDGWVVPCDLHCDNEIVFGNAFTEGFMKVWNNKKAREFRKNLLVKRTGVCSRCCVDESFILGKLKPFYKTPIINKLSHRT